jgi:hypothetical protein
VTSALGAKLSNARSKLEGNAMKKGGSKSEQGKKSSKVLAFTSYLTCEIHKDVQYMRGDKCRKCAKEKKKR